MVTLDLGKIKTMLEERIGSNKIIWLLEIVGWSDKLKFGIYKNDEALFMLEKPVA